MDVTLDNIAQFATSTRPGKIPADVLDKADKILLDSLACAYAGLQSPGAKVAAAITDIPRGTPGTVIGTHAEATLDMAAFWNTCMIRYADCNDSLTGGHPSDMFGPLIAVAGAHGLPGRTLLSGIAVAYEVFHLLIFKSRQYYKHKGALVDNLSFDQGFYVATSAAAGIAHMLQYDKAKTAAAVSLAATSGLPLRASRAGELSHYKGVATAVSSRAAVFACQLAESGLTAPSAPFEGRHGFIEIFEGKAGPMNLGPLGEWYILRTALKYFPATANCQVSIWTAREMRALVDVEQVREIVLHTSRFLWHESGSEPAKWAPTTHETADHSLPYIFTTALVDGNIDLRSYDDDKLARPHVLALMQKVKVVVDPEIEAAYPAILQIRAVATLVDGTTREVHCKNPKGVPLNPMNRDDIKIKFQQLAGPTLGDKTDKFWDLACTLADSANIKTVFKQMVVE
ncbi:hypothetical protein SBRCBS47491_009945 [Sporothrix bragantina]|uniref:MmgE/PrpD family protein n=1 Tax=Sporothrix bragantina TaxID=671064 RepID=A0ABP0CYX6_9PEZI